MQEQIILNPKQKIIIKIKQSYNIFSKFYGNLDPKCIQILPAVQKDYDTIKQNIKLFLQKIQKIIKKSQSQQPLNLAFLMIVFQYVGKNIEVDLLKTYNNITDYTIMLLKNDYKISVMLIFLEEAMELPLDRITLGSETDNYKKIESSINFIKIQQQKKLKQKIDDMGDMLMATSAVIIKEEEITSEFGKKAIFGLSFLHYKVQTRQSYIKSFNYYRKPNINLAKKIWNLPESGLVSMGMKITLPSIKYMKKIYIPRKQLSPNNDIDLFRYDPNKICVRYIANEDYFQNVNFGHENTCCGIVWNKFKFVQKVIIHMHGGGFIALSSRTTQSYTRLWAKQVDAPVFSIDYGLAPEAPFPNGLYDCFYVYSFIINHISKYSGIRPKKIILTGDSAGGNLSLSLTALLMQKKMPLPHALYVAYPATDMRKVFTPSRLYSLDDKLLIATLLFICRDSYIGTDKETNPLLSPILITEKFTNPDSQYQGWPRKWPKTRILVGTKDPLYDDSLRLLQKMRQSDIDCKLTVLEGLIHACLSLDFAIPQCQIAIQQSIKQLKQLFKQQVIIGD